MSDKRREESPGTADYDVFDEPLVRYGGDAILELTGGEKLDLNALPDPFTGEEPEAAPLTGLRSPGADRAEARVHIGRRLQALREDNGLSRRQLGLQTGVAERRIAAAEQGKDSMAMSLISSLVRAMGERMAEIADPDAPEQSMRVLIRTAVQAGAPPRVAQRISHGVGRRRLADALARAFGWTRDALLTGAPRSPSYKGAVVFKARERQVADDAPSLALARMLSGLSVSSNRTPFGGVPEDPNDLRRQVTEGTSDIDLEALLGWSWDNGVVVLPIADGRDFTAAAWFIDGTPVIVLNESRKLAAYWLFDLAHELGHLGRGHVGSSGIVDLDSPSRPDLTDEQEREANAYAIALLLPDPEGMLDDVRKRTAGDAPKNFKFAVRDVAKKAAIAAGPLGLIAAYAMSDVPRAQDRWGSANNLATAEDPDGRARVEAAFVERLSFDELDEVDTAVLRAATLSA